MAADPSRGPGAPAGGRRLSTAEASFYASVYHSARKGSLAELQRTGCDEAEAEELFATAFQRVMETVDPIERKFSAPEMVNFIKRAAWRCMIDDRRRRGRRPELDIGSLDSLSDPGAENPSEVAEERELAAIVSEAVQMLSERDRLVFRQRHQMNLSPEEILQNMPGLSRRTYRKVIERANSRVLEAFERIDRGERCAEMERSILRRFVADECPESERLEVQAHLSHCRACRQTQMRMRGYLVDVAGALLAASAAAGRRHLAQLADLPARLLETVNGGAQGVLEATRSARERARELAMRIAGGVPGAGGDATVGQALTATSVKVASACAATLAAGACVAAGVVPGVGGLALLDHPDIPRPRPSQGAKQQKSTAAPQDSSAVPADAVREEARDQPSRRRSRKSQAVTPSRGGTTEEASDSPDRVPSTAAEAKESGEVTGSEFSSSGTPVSPTATTPSAPTSSAAPAPARSAGVAPSSPQGDGSQSTSGGSEFGM